jgi:hypothetical protein
MASNKPAYLHSPRFTANQREVLDAIGKALKYRRIDFFTATELGDMVKAGRLNEVLAILEVYAATKATKKYPPQHPVSNKK